MGGQLPSLQKSMVWQRDVISLKHVSLYRHIYLGFCMLTSWQSTFVEIGLAVYGQWTSIAVLLYMEISSVGTCNTKQFSLQNASVVPGADPSSSSEWLTVFLFLESPMNSKITIKM